MKIFFLDNLKKIESFMRHADSKAYCLVLKDEIHPQENRLLARYRDILAIVDRERLTTEKRDAFKKDFVEFIDRLNDVDRPFDWEALNFVNKSRLSLSFYTRLFQMRLIDNLLSDLDGIGALFIISGDRLLLTAVRHLAKDRGHEFVAMVPLTLKDFASLVNRRIPVLLCLTFLRMTALTLLTRVFFREAKFNEKRYYVIRSTIGNSSFTKSGEFRDAYFHKFIDYLKKRSVPTVIYASIFRPYLGNIRKIKSGSGNEIIIPKERYLSMLDLVKCLTISLRRNSGLFDLSGPLYFKGMDIGYLVRSEIKDECASKYFFSNLLEYFCAKKMVRHINIDKILYPFEHRSWESMFITAIRLTAPQARIIGYQHAAITPKHTDLILGESEARRMALPDKIICMGKITKNILENTGNFPGKILEICCALRQDVIRQPEERRGATSRISNILVALSNEPGEYASVIKFLNEAISYDNCYNIMIRPHPLSKIASGRRLENGSGFKIDRNITLDEALSWSDMVVYCASTVSIEAIQRGRPVLYIDFKGLLRPDPLFDLNDFKWTVSRPEEFIRIIDGIKNTPMDIFEKARQKAVEYANEYIYPATTKNLQRFHQICECQDVKE